jgi:hypothetical protein
MLRGGEGRKSRTSIGSEAAILRVRTALRF